VMVLTNFDYDHDLVALRAFSDLVAASGHPMLHVLALQPNSGVQTGLDLDGDGQVGGRRDAQGYGRFAGDGGIAVLSRHPLATTADLTGLLWRDLPGNLVSEEEKARFGDIQRLSSTGHWVVRVDAPGGPFDVMAYAATPPVFDGPEDRNGRRNHDETALWLRYLDTALGPVPERPFVIAGLVNLDPEKGEGLRGALIDLLAHPRVTDPRPAGAGGRDTVDWDDDDPPRVAADRHKLVWVDLAR
jgi:hypothetical protein